MTSTITADVHTSGSSLAENKCFPDHRTNISSTLRGKF